MPLSSLFYFPGFWSLVPAVESPPGTIRAMEIPSVMQTVTEPEMEPEMEPATGVTETAIPAAIPAPQERVAVWKEPPRPV